MPIEKYLEHPALRPTILVHEALKNVYRPTLRELPANSPAATDEVVARETPRAA
jgi:hypothetical protein